MNDKHKIISVIVELMKDGLSYSSIRNTIVSKFGLSEEVANEYVKEAFETVSFIAKNKGLSRSEKIMAIVVGFSMAIICAVLYAFAIIKSGYNLVLFIVIFAYLISKSIYLVVHKKIGIFLQVLCGILTVLCYLIGEYIVYISILKREISLRGLIVENQYQFFLISIRTFIMEYLAKKGIYEIILIICAVLFAASFFTGLKLKRIRD